MSRHVEALAGEFLRRGDDVRVLAPVDPPDRLSRVLHRAPAERRELPDYLIPLGRTVGIGANGAVSNLSATPAGGFARVRSELRSGGYDVIHVHEPLVPLVGWNAVLGARTPVVGTFHAYATKALPNHIASGLGARRVFNRLSARIAVSEAAAWTGRRWFGGRYEIVPNGVDVSAAPQGPKPPSDELRLVFVGRPEARKGLPVLLTAFEALVEHVPSRLTVIGAEREDVQRYLADRETMRWIDVRGRVSGPDLWTALHGADLLCAPSLSGESFGMVLTEAFAAGTPAIASRDRRLQRRGHRRRRRHPRPARRPAAHLPRSCSRPTTSPSASPRWARRRGRAPSATPGRGSPTESARSTSGRSRRRGPRAPASAPPTGSASARPTAARPARRAACPRSTRRRRRPAAAGAASPAASGSASPACSASA